MGSETPVDRQPRLHLHLHSSNLQSGVEAELEIAGHTAKAIISAAVPTVPSPQAESELDSEEMNYKMTVRNEI